jgi:hypothetical protein
MHGSSRVHPEVPRGKVTQERSHLTSLRTCKKTRGREGSGRTRGLEVRQVRHARHCAGTPLCHLLEKDSVN